MKIVSIFLVVIAILALFVGFTNASGAPQESVVVGLACFIGILARIAQAAGQQDEIMKRLNN